MVRITRKNGQAPRAPSPALMPSVEYVPAAAVVGSLRDSAMSFSFTMIIPPCLEALKPQLPAVCLSGDDVVSVFKADRQEGGLEVEAPDIPGLFVYEDDDEQKSLAVNKARRKAGGSSLIKKPAKTPSAKSTKQRRRNVRTAVGDPDERCDLDLPLVWPVVSHSNKRSLETLYTAWQLSAPTTGYDGVKAVMKRQGYSAAKIDLFVKVRRRADGQANTRAYKAPRPSTGL